MHHSLITFRTLPVFGQFLRKRSGNPKPHPSKPHPCNMPQAKTEVALQFSECCAAEVALQHSLFCSVEVVSTKSCAAASEKLQCNIEKAALQESGAFLPLSCGFQAPTFRHPRLGPAEIGAEKSTQTFFVQSFSTTLRVMDVHAENRGRPRQKVRFPAAPVMGRNFLTPGHPGVRVRNVRGKSGPKSLCLCCFSSRMKRASTSRHV